MNYLGHWMMRSKKRKYNLKKLGKKEELKKLEEWKKSTNSYVNRVGAFYILKLLIYKTI